MINIVIADHLGIFRAGLARVLAAEDDIRIVGQTDCQDRLINAALRYRPKVISVSTAFLPVLPRLRAVSEEQNTALLMIAEKNDDLAQYVEWGFRGVITRSADSPAFLHAFRQLAAGECFMQSCPVTVSDITAENRAALASSRLSPTELRIIAAAMRGYRNREIAHRLGAKEPWVKNALRNIFDKLGTCDRLEMTLYVLQNKKLAHAVAAHATGLGGAAYRFAARDFSTGKAPQVN